MVNVSHVRGIHSFILKTMTLIVLVTMTVIVLVTMTFIVLVTPVGWSHYNNSSLMVLVCAYTLVMIFVNM